MKNKRKNSGFTLIELVVVVAIIGVLAAIVAPRIRLSLMRAKDARVVASLDALRTATNVYYAEKGIPPYKLAATDTLPTTDGTPLNIGHLALLVQNGYLDKTSALKFYSGNATAFDAIVTNPTTGTGGLVGIPATLQDDTDCLNVLDDPDTPENEAKAADPSYQQGFIGYVWAKDGIGLQVGTSSTSTGPFVIATDKQFNTDCELWSSK